MFANLKKKLSKTSHNLIHTFEKLRSDERQREEIFNELSEALILADVGIITTEKIIKSIKEKTNKKASFDIIKKNLEEEILNIISSHSVPFDLDREGSVIMFVGVNGGGKTTSIAKLAHLYKSRGQNVILVAADTFRAAAQEQLSIWGKRLNLPVVRSQIGADPASVVFDAIQSFKIKQTHALLIDTAGRIHTNVNLMNELEKMKRIIAREIPGEPHEILLVLDASIGQNAMIQAKEFTKFSGITGIFLTKLDGTAKGGSVISAVDNLQLPIKFIGIGEKKEDMIPFSPRDFVQALLS